jgi:riboflavin biosynthesis pyrimidine reductase
MTDAIISRVWPPPATALNDEKLAECYAITDRSEPQVRFNFVSSIDGAATVNGLSGGLSGKADKRVFDLLRRVCDVVLVGAGTLRAEGYGAMRLDRASVQWRLANGLAGQPVFAIVSGTLGIDAASHVFTEAPVRPVVVTVGSASDARKAVLSRVADVLLCGEETLDARGMLVEFAKRGLRRILSEGGPKLFGTLLEADCVDELCLTVSPLLAAGKAARIAAGALGDARRMTLHHVLISDSTVMLRYGRLQVDR